ncbi:MAG: carbohydrate ABC transporter permease [Actinomycetota bacterium]|nr:carbohydrate ABC transporter permease [Actinomycetota bacterium]
MIGTTTPPVRPATPLEPRSPRVKGPRASRGRRVVIASLLTLVSVAFVYPFLWLISASLKPRAQTFDNRLIPSEWAARNYTEVLSTTKTLLWLGNSVLVGVVAAAAVTISSAIVAFGFAYFRFRGRGVLFGLVLATMMLPAAVTMVPTYLIWDGLGLASTQVPLWAQNLFGSAFYIFLIRQFFLAVPRELFEAARVDGASHATMFWRIAMPICVPALIVTFVFELRASWTDLIKPLIYLRDPDLYTLPRGLKAVLDQFGQGGESKWEIVLTASAIATIPMIIAFFLAQRYIIDGIATTGRKG